MVANFSWKKQGIFGILFIAMAVVGLYLTTHYFDSVFPEQEAVYDSCGITPFFSCHSATFSVISNIAGVPIAFLGVLVGLLLFSGFFVSSVAYWSSLALLSALNAFGCLVLFAYSLIFLRGLCPYCSLYYLFSFAVVGLFWKESILPKFSLKHMAIFASLFIFASGILKLSVISKEKTYAQMQQEIAAQLKTLTPLKLSGEPSPYLLNSLEFKSSKEETGPITIEIFSDFQCAFCKKVAPLLDFLEKRFPGKITFRYYFYPLDSQCNGSVQARLHPLACLAAYVASCSPNFKETHDKIFDRQDSLSKEWLEELAVQQKITECVNSPETKQKIVAIVEQGNQIGVESTPTLLINGIRLPGVRPTQQYVALIQSLLQH